MSAAVTWPPVVDDPDATGPLHGRVHVQLAVPTPADVWDTARWDTARWDAGGATVFDVTCDCDGVDLTIGRDTATSHVAPGTAKFAVANASGEFTPWANTPARRRRWWIGAPVRISTSDGPLFTGYVAEMTEQDAAVPDEDRMTVFTALGPAGFLALANGLEQGDQGANETAGPRLDRICDQASLPAWIVRDFDAGVIPMQSTTLAKGALEEAWLTADSDGGALLEDQAGALVFLEMATLDNDPRYTEPQVTFIDDSPADPDDTVQCMTALTTTLAADNVVNQVSIAAAGGTAHVATRPADSWAGSRTFQRHDLIHNDEPHSQTLADAILERLAAGELLAEPVEFDVLLSDANWQAAHSLRPYDRVRIIRTREADVGIQRLDLVASVNRLHHTITNLGWNVTVESSPGTQRFDFARWDVARWDDPAATWE